MVKFANAAYEDFIGDRVVRSLNYPSSVVDVLEDLPKDYRGSGQSCSSGAH